MTTTGWTILDIFPAFYVFNDDLCLHLSVLLSPWMPLETGATTARETITGCAIPEGMIAVQHPMRSDGWFVDEEGLDLPVVLYPVQLVDIHVGKLLPHLVANHPFHSKNPFSFLFKYKKRKIYIKTSRDVRSLEFLNLLRLFLSSSKSSAMLMPRSMLFFSTNIKQQYCSYSSTCCWFLLISKLEWYKFSYKSLAMSGPCFFIENF